MGSVIKLKFNNYKYPKKLIEDYINCNDIVEYDVDELESNCEFMIDVIKYTNDKNMYNLCSKELQTNYDFVMFLIKHFSNDVEFIESVADTYIESASDVTLVEINILMMKYSKNIKYAAEALAFYNSQLIEIELTKMEFDDIDVGEGFVFIDHTYNSDIISEFFASKFLYKIFYENDNMTFEDILHSKFLNVGDLEKYGIKRFIIDYVNTFDKYLGSYICVHMNLLDNYITRIRDYINRWENYVREKIYILYDMLSDYIEDTESYIYIFDLLNYALDMLGLEYGEEDLCFPIDDDYQKMTKEEESSVSTISIKMYAVNLAKQIFYNKDKLDKKNNNTKTNQKILKINFNKKEIIK